MSACDAPAILSDGNEAITRREALKEWSPFSLTQFSSSHKKPLPRAVRIYSDGVFDLFHNGHAEQLRQAKTLLPNSYLIVGVCSDYDVLAFKGTRPVMTQEERCATVRHCRYVDEVFLDPPFYPTLEFVDAIKVDLVAHDGIPYNSTESADCYAPFKAACRFLTTERTPSVSTTELLARIMDNYEIFKKRGEMRNKVPVFKTMTADQGMHLL